MRLTVTPRLLLLLAVSPLAVLDSGCGGNPPTASVEVAAQQHQQSVRAIQNDPRLAPTAKQAMIAAMRAQTSDSVKASVVAQTNLHKGQDDLEIQRVQNNPKLSADDKRNIIAQIEARQQTP